VRLIFDRLSARHPAARLDSVPALKGVSIAIEPGEQVAVIGPSGAGKTTFLHAAACALKPASGQLQLDALDPWAQSASGLQALRAKLFLAPQVPPLPPRQRVVTAVLAGQLPHWSLRKSLKSLFYPQDAGLAHDALQPFDVADKLFERVDRLSGGERQRVGLARLLAAKASLWLVDEPLSALDPTRATLALDALTGQARSRAATLVCTLHQVDRALAAFPRIIGLRNGELAFDLPSSEVSRDRLQTLYAQFEHELNGGAGANEFPEAPAAPAAPAVMHCR
jgi:phosphonate transport system ATP-binding protein